MLKLQNISYTYPTPSNRKEHGNTIANGRLKNISLSLEEGAVASIMGESGCGKSTLLDLIYGLLQPQQGNLYWKGQELKGADHYLIPGHPMMKYVPQEFDLMPYTTVTENVGEHLSIQRDDYKDRINELLQVVEMDAFAARKVNTLSGGQKQRVAIAKALAQEPELLLLDEPFSHVDNFKKNTLRRRLFHYVHAKNISVIIATHDREDVLSFSTTTIIMKQGAVIDHRNTANLYKNPRILYTASLFDEVNDIPIGLIGNDQSLILYPHELSIANQGKQVVVVKSYFKGDHFLIHCLCERCDLWVSAKEKLEAGQEINIALK